MTEKRTYAFVDADNLKKSMDKLLKDRGFNDEEIKLFQYEKLFHGHDRAFAYLAKTDSDDLPEWIRKLQATSCIVRFGRLSEKNGTKKQEGVDVMLAVDAMKHAHRGNFDECVLFSGDGDFLPLIEALVDEGITVQVVTFADPDQGTVTPELRNRADKFRRLGVGDLLDILPFNIRPSWISDTGSVHSDFEEILGINEIVSGSNIFKLEKRSNKINSEVYFALKVVESNGQGQDRRRLYSFESPEKFDLWLRLTGFEPKQWGWD